MATRILSFLVASLLAGSVFAEDLSRTDFRSSICNIERMDVSFRLGETFGEPLVTSAVRWNAGPNTASDCLASGITHVWIKVRNDDDSVRYVRLRPDFPAAGADYSATATESPSWSVLFCERPSDGARCDPEPVAKATLAGNLRFEGFEVTTEALAISTLGAAGGSRNAGGSEATGNSNDNLFDDLLLDVIDTAVRPEGTVVEEVEPEAPAVVTVAPEDIARAALDQVVTLVSSTLSEYATPPHSCETQRKVNHWVQARSTCELTFRSESNHQYLCGNGGTPQPMRVTRNATVNLGTDIAAIDDIRYAEGQWASLVMEFKGEKHTDVEAKYTSNRWQITTDDARLPDLKRLASSLEALRAYCENNVDASATASAS